MDWSLPKYLNLIKAAQVEEDQLLLEKGEKKVYRRSALVDPNMIVSFGGASYGAYRPRYSHLSFKVLKEMSLKDPIVASIIQTRVQQVSAFARPQASRYDTGFKLVPVDTNVQIKPGSAEEKDIEFLTEFIQHTGYDDEHRADNERMTFDMFLKLAVRDRLTYGALAIEKVPCEDGSLFSFLPVPTETIYYANKNLSDKLIDNIKTMNKKAYFAGVVQEGENTEVEELKQKLKEGEYEYVQVIEGRIVEGFTKDNMIYKLGNPQNFIDNNGYAIGELEMATNIVTSHLQALNYNKLFFCIASSSLIRTDAGSLQIGKAYEKFGDSIVNIWSGNRFHPGKVYKTRKLEECETHLKSGQILRTSDEHWFYILREGDTEPKFINQRDIQIGDFVLRSSDGYEASEDCPRKVYNNNLQSSHSQYNEWDSTPVKEDLFEVLGWLAGDGHIGGQDKTGGKGRECPVQLFYHWSKELDIRQKHFETLQKYGIKCHLKERPVSKANIKKHGHATSPRIFIFDTAFKKWLLDLGFGSSPDKGVPDVLFQMPQSYRVAFLRGLFSADGYIHKNKMDHATPCLAAKDEAVRSGAASLLNSLGVSCTVIKATAGGKRVVTGLRIQDVGAFKKIGFIQDHKNEFKKRDFRNNSRYDLLTYSLSKAIALKLQNKVTHSGIRAHIGKILQGKSRFSRHNARSLCADYNLSEFMDVLSFQLVPVVSTKATGQVIQMYDVEILDPIHRFTLDGVVVHNTHGTAARGMLHIKGDVTPAQLQAFRAQWYAQIAGNTNSWRTPILAGVDEVNWIPLSASNRDMEYSVYIDHIIRTLCSLFQISPLEFGFDYLDKGSGQKALSESNNQWKLKEAKNRGLRPLLIWIEGLINNDIIPAARPDLAGKYKFCFVGLDAESREEELNRLKAETELHTSLNDIRKEIKKDPVLGGNVPLNPLFIDFLMKTHTIGEIREYLLGYTGEADNPLYDYVPESGFFQNRTEMFGIGAPQPAPVGPDGEEVEGEEAELPAEEGRPASEGQEMAPQGSSNIEQVVSAYLEKHPELIEKSIRGKAVKSVKPDLVNSRFDQIKHRNLTAYKDVEQAMLREILEALKEEAPKE